MKKERKINWKKAGTEAALIVAGAGLFLLGVLAGRITPEKKLEIENKFLERELAAARNQVADLTRHVGNLSYRHGKLADRLATYKKRQE
jgi:hypothetical protein